MRSPALHAPAPPGLPPQPQWVTQAHPPASGCSGPPVQRRATGGFHRRTPRRGGRSRPRLRIGDRRGPWRA
eukprot:scaffold12236_cov73-Isochrysis_galbana.AAC.2